MKTSGKTLSRRNNNLICEDLWKENIIEAFPYRNRDADI